MSQLNSEIIEEGFIESFILAWKQKHYLAFEILNEVLEDGAILYLINEYLSVLIKNSDTLTSADKTILKCFTHFELVDVLMGEKSVEEKFAALSKWENNLLEIIGNDITEVLVIGRVAGATKMRISENPKIRAFKKREESLKKGRIQGAQVQKSYAAATKNMISIINLELLKHPDTARWTLDQRAKHIEGVLIQNNRKQINGKPYKVSTIRLIITGKG